MTGRGTCEKESEVRSENDSEEEETYDSSQKETYCANFRGLQFYFIDLRDQQRNRQNPSKEEQQGIGNECQRLPERQQFLSRAS